MYIQTNSNVIINENIAVRKYVSVIPKLFEEEQDISINWQRNTQEFKKIHLSVILPVRHNSVEDIVIWVTLVGLTGEDRGIKTKWQLMTLLSTQL